MIWAAIREHSADAALVALVVQKTRVRGRLFVVSNSRLAKVSVFTPSVAALPPSNTTSGLSGQARSSHPNELDVSGLSAPLAATGLKCWAPASVMAVFSVKAPTVSAFQD